MKQLLLLTDDVRPEPEPPLARVTDPVTSHESADAVRSSGRLAEQHEAVLNLVRRYRDRTSAELAVLGGMERHVPGRRLCELERHGLVEVSGRRPCSTNGRSMQTYRAVTQGGVSITEGCTDADSGTEAGREGTDR